MPRTGVEKGVRRLRKDRTATIKNGAHMDPAEYAVAHGAVLAAVARCAERIDGLAREFSGDYFCTAPHPCTLEEVRLALAALPPTADAPARGTLAALHAACALCGDEHLPALRAAMFPHVPSRRETLEALLVVLRTAHAMQAARCALEAGAARASRRSAEQ